MIRLLQFLHVIELLICLPAFILCFLMYFVSKNQLKADLRVRYITEKRLTWLISLPIDGVLIWWVWI